MAKYIVCFSILLLLLMNFFCIAICVSVLLYESHLLTQLCIAMAFAAITIAINMFGWEILESLKKQSLRTLEVRIKYLSCHVLFAAFVCVNVFANIFAAAIFLCEATIPHTEANFLYVPDVYLRKIAQNFIIGMDLLTLVVMLSMAPCMSYYCIIKKCYKKEILCRIVS